MAMSPYFSMKCMAISPKLLPATTTLAPLSAKPQNQRVKGFQSSGSNPALLIIFFYIPKAVCGEREEPGAGAREAGAGRRH